MIALCLLLFLMGLKAYSQEKSLEEISLPAGHWTETLNSMIQSLKREGYEFVYLSTKVEAHNKVVCFGDTTRHFLFFRRKSNTLTNFDGSPQYEEMKIEVVTKKSMSSPTDEPRLRYQITNWNIR